MAKYYNIALFDAVTIFILATLAIYHLLVFIRRRKIHRDKESLYLFIMLGALAVLLYLDSYLPGLLRWPQLRLANTSIFAPSSSITKPFLTQLFSIIVFAGYISCIETVTQFRFNKIFKISVYSLMILFLIVTLYSLGGYWNMVHTYQYCEHFSWIPAYGQPLMYLALLVYFSIVFFKRRLYRNRAVTYLLAGTVLLQIYIIINIIYYPNHMTKLNFNPVPIPAALLFALALAEKFHNEFAELVRLRSDLETVVTERTEELKIAQNQMIQMNKRKTEAFINLAHETRTPLTLISYYLDKLQVQRRSENDLDVLKRNAAKMQRDMLNFLDTEKLHRGEIIYENGQIADLSTLAADASSFFKPFIEDKKLTFQSSVAEDCFCQADPKGLDRILNNLLMNAYKYTDEGHIALNLEKKDNQLTLRVSNTAYIEKEFLETIFSPYVQLTSKKTGGQGYGMGLYITKMLVENLKGKITVESDEEHGTVFKAVIPSANPDMEIPIPQEGPSPYDMPFTLPSPMFTIDEEEQEESGPRKKILCVEDNQDLLELLHAELSVHYNVDTAVSGRLALRRLHASSLPDLIISDIMMPDGDGIEFFNNVQEDPQYSGIPFIFLTAAQSQQDKIKYLGEGAADYLQKPFSVEELKARIFSLFKVREKHREQIIQQAVTFLQNNLMQKDSVNEPIQLFEKRCQEWGVTPRQQEIILMISRGLQHKEIASELNIAETTVARHIQNIYEKYEVHNKVELINKFLST